MAGTGRGLARALAAARSGAWLPAGELRALLTAALGAWLAVAAAALVFAAQGAREGSSVPGTDFTVFYAAGLFARAGEAAAAYDTARLAAAVADAFGPAAPVMPWPYPPVMLPLVAVLAGLPYGVALALWSGGSLGALALAVRLAAPAAGLLGGGAWLLAAAAPAGLVNLIAGQGGALFAGLLLGALWRPGAYPLRAGMCAGLLVLKPHLAVLVPLALLAGGHRRAFAVAAGTALLALAAATAWTGPGAWAAWADLLGSETLRALREAPSDMRMPSVFAGLRMLGVPAGPAQAGQLAAALAAAYAVVRAWRAPGTAPEDRAALVLLSGPLVSSYLWFYDTVALAAAVALVAARGLRDGFRPWEVTALTAAWLAPLAVLATSALRLPVPVLNLAAVLAFAAVARGVLAPAPAPRPAPAVA